MNYTILFTGPFAFIKPWTAVRDEKTQSQQFLSPGTLEGLSKKLFGLESSNRIRRHRLYYEQMDEQQEQTRAKEIKVAKKKGQPFIDGIGILSRVVLLAPRLYLAFATEAEAQEALKQHICLCRNEDLLLPDADFGVQPMDEETFEDLPGFELVFDHENPTNPENGFPAGRHRYREGHPQTYGQLIFREA